VSDTQLIVVASTGYSPSKYRLYSLGMTGNALHVQWQGDGVGIYSKTCPLYDGKYLAVGSYGSVLHVYCDYTVMVENGRLVEHRHEDSREAVQEAKLIQYSMCGYR
jgi:hypothetical protein